ncbi:AbrB/MazE/SpoVT family DNA-binding domain-containing protein [Pseudomonas sp. SED1]|uniref:AbrB/MazE/SpoVT family DNA-binding domain-containing protein n=1 Tax=Pseudomonas sp. SED1 TaxID=3056845 RepID=UPI00296EC752|nr:AbrB/MazE/SpoVT family DNA-binding domain-containing protein [Pseudomonas sp. SED1]MDY0836529.1 AbrB/MazE/SpoVT family DNA-binding domain-containing protein [Pseudomonas sp. SED1]
MSESFRAIVKCQHPGDGSGDVIIDLPPDVLAALNVSLGDLLSIELVEGSIVMKPIRNAHTKP